MEVPTTSTKLIVVDTDAGVDDACALLLLLSKHRKSVELLGITTVRGNVGADQVCLNALRILQLTDNMDIPVYRGMDTSYTGALSVCTECYHGNDGLGDVPDSDAPDSSHVNQENAALAIVRMVNQHPGKISLVCLGPLTNIAVALKLDPDLGKKLSNCYVMGGNYTGKGNVTSSAEFNFHSDPEAADVVLRVLHCPITLITWELCIECASSWEWFDRLTSFATTRSRFVRAITSKPLDTYYSGGQSSIEDRKYYITCDEIAAAVAVDERIVTRVNEVTCCGVDRTGHLTRGQVIIDWNRSTPKPAHNDDSRCTLRLVTGINQELYENMLLDAVSIE